ncbi:cytochrome d ubiquinol oxidase subunit II [Caldimonas thermodepolymerans]|jgi:cytochrome d ubiquinol oxidase subunit II|uniref:Cytochrome BD ubiquinol oxidase subunit II n=1 Tax=Caldimonas thermodepolymerans TaxID=215580 RepID=A0A2S5T1S3_9BURK|nr:cytochrome d ubiquinol oxidase subunit II [Caldimonas thermodepolymerans]PPE68879.1 cytochrome BD ubiquinol oxidase subunit II [Caldimonas thermodepolymerans]QPC30419.1 cytochrome d ubiquinol oxidase subunit II [Caldimonas thermodepolymerans]RDI03002.1 cytochrome bd-I ubiquinol oxidase subunit 2 apoprotein [Caldimonas thermodepolymerans]UZG43185.1 cytochrome d ubiquinol oxidase subunit II [Caldimonas thermodepolymerans]
MNAETLLPVIFMAVMGLALLAYVVLDGYDLGVGMLMHRANDAEKDTMVASIGPFWDANETWLVLGVGLLLIAFPKAQGVVLTALYLPTAAMLIGLILRGVAFDFRVKARAHHKPLWDRAFMAGSAIAALAQGWMLGRYVTGFADGALATGFAAAIALTLPAAYVMLGATWLVMKTDGALQAKAVRWAKLAWAPMVAGIVLISLATPLVSATVRERWFSMPGIIALLPIPLTTAVALVAARLLLNSSRILGKDCWAPFALVVGVFVLSFFGLAYSLYPYVVMDRITIWQAASAPASLAVILIGTAISVPAIIVYTVFAYRVFWGKTGELRYA